MKKSARAIQPSLPEIRARAEKELGEKITRHSKLSREEAEDLIHELGVHQIELEIQNEELRRAQEELEMSRRRYAELYEFAPAGYFTFDSKGRIREMNQTGAALLGSAKGSLQSGSFYSLIVDHEEREQFRAVLSDVFENEFEKPIDIRLRKRDGSIFDARLQVVRAQEPVMKEACCRAIVIDITERKQLEAALHASEKNYRLLFDKSPLAKWVIDLETSAFLEVNDAAVEHYGYTREEFRKLTLADIRIDEQVVGSPAENEPGSPRSLEGTVRTKHRKKNGETIDVDVRHAEIIYHGRRAVLSVMVDIADLVRAQEERERLIAELRRSNKELQDFAYVASHDLQEPLRTIASYVDLLSVRYQGKLDDKADRFISFAIEGAHRMSNLIDDLLAYSRVGTRGKPFEPVELGAILKVVVENLRRTIEENGAEITADDLPAVIGDASQLMQLLQNLIENGIKFRKKEVPPRIHISTKRDTDKWIFGVQDNGIGIKPDFYERIFIIFQRLHTREEYAGTGVGLAICRRIVERHGGKMWVESKPGEGSTFYFTLPEGGKAGSRGQ